MAAHFRSDPQSCKSLDVSILYKRQIIADADDEDTLDFVTNRNFGCQPIRLVGNGSGTRFPPSSLVPGSPSILSTASSDRGAKLKQEKSGKSKKAAPAKSTRRKKAQATKKQAPSAKLKQDKSPKPKQAKPVKTKQTRKLSKKAKT